RHAGGLQLVGERVDDTPADDLADAASQLVAVRRADHRQRDRADAALIVAAEHLLERARQVDGQGSPRLTLERREVQAFLRAEVARDERRVDTRALADLAHRRGVVAALVEQRLGRLQQRLAARPG